MFAVLLAFATLQASQPASAASQGPQSLTAQGGAAATLREQQEAANTAAPGVVCVRERVMGSNRFRRVCTTSAQRDQKSTAAQRILENNTGGVPVQPEN